MRRPNLALVLALILLSGLGLMLLLPLITAVPDPHLGILLKLDGTRYRPPPFRPGQLGYVLGSDFVGRDLFGRIVYGARLTLGLALLVNLLRMAVAVPLGLAAGWTGGRLSRLVQTAAAGFGAVPALVLVFVSLATLRRLLPGQAGWLAAYVVILVLSGLPRMADAIRRRAEEILLLPHVEAAESLGAGPQRILARHVLPLMRVDLLIAISAEMAWVLLLMAQLAIFGFYVGGTVVVETNTGNVLHVEHLAEWGQILGANRARILSYPWIPFYPGLALGLTAAAFHLLAEGLRGRTLR